MLFSSMFFLWVFLPIVLILYWIIPSKYIQVRNIFLMLASLIFYAWGEPGYIILLILVVIINYICALIIDESPYFKGFILFICVALNLSLLGYYKYFNFIISTVLSITGRQILEFREIALPLGISFYVFQALSYSIDVYRKRTPSQSNFFKLLLYISMFPQLVAGPIVQYKDVASQIDHRTLDSKDIAYGIKRFSFGLGKKVIFSNILAQYADEIINGELELFSSGVLWLGILLYLLQLYFDFSGYSDMAIGLGRMFGFKFNENFNYPYISKSMSELWRRWHISLNTWFREYVYFPMGGSRKGVLRTYFNLIVLMLLSGLWHGAGITFIIWGLINGFFLILEKMFLGKVLAKNPIKIINNLYSLFVFIISLVFFRIDSLGNALYYFKKMFSLSGGEHVFFDFIDLKVAVIGILAALFSGFLQEWIKPLKADLFNEEKTSIFDIVSIAIILFISFVLLISDAYNPFIYFRF